MCKWTREPHRSALQHAISAYRNDGASSVQVERMFGVPARTLRRYVAASRNLGNDACYIAKTSRKRKQRRVREDMGKFGQYSQQVCDAAMRCTVFSKKALTPLKEPAANPVSTVWPQLATPEPTVPLHPHMGQDLGQGLDQGLGQGLDQGLDQNSDQDLDQVAAQADAAAAAAAAAPTDELQALFSNAGCGQKVGAHCAWPLGTECPWDFCVLTSMLPMDMHWASLDVFSDMLSTIHWA